MDLAANNIPAQEIGGDFYDYIPISRGSWGLVIADVSGKGMPAAIFMGLSRTIVRASATDNPSPAAAIKQANELICRDSTSGMFVTLFYAILNAKERKLRYVNAGHNPPLLIRNGGEVESLRTRGIALGVTHYIDLQEAERILRPGDTIVFYTDGVTEAARSGRRNGPFIQCCPECGKGKESGGTEIPFVPQACSPALRRRSSQSSLTMAWIWSRSSSLR